MNYSGTAILALLVHIIINYDVLRNAHYRAGSPAASAYRTFIFGVMVFYLKIRHKRPSGSNQHSINEWLIAPLMHFQCSTGDGSLC